MKQHNFTQTLKVIRDLVMRSRPCYRDYLGSETVTKIAQIGSGVFESMEGAAKAELSVIDSAFTGFILGETYTVTIDGVAADYVARNLSSLSGLGPVIGTTTTVDNENLSFDGWLIAAFRPESDFICVAQTFDTSFTGKTISVSQTKTETVTRYSTKLLPEYLLPSFLRKNVVATKTEVQSVAADVDGAYTQADAAKTTADAAQNLANDAKILSETVTNSTNVVFRNRKQLPDGSIDADGARYWDDWLWTTVLVGSQITFEASNSKATGVWNGKKLVLKFTMGNEERTVIFSLRPTGRGMLIKIPDPAWSENLALRYSWTEVVPWRNNDDIGTAAIIPDYAITSGIRLISTTGNKQFRITVDDTGTLKATEVREAT